MTHDKGRQTDEGHPAVTALDAHIAALRADTLPVPGPTRPWTFDVEYIGGAQPTDYGTGTECDGSWQWAIFDGPSEQTDVVLLGIAEDEDPTPVLAALVADHNRLLPARPSPTDDDPWAENAKLWADLTRAISERNAVAEAAAAHVHPGPDHEDERIRQELIAGWMDRGRDDADSWRQSWEKAARERNELRAEIERLRAHQEPGPEGER